MYIPLTREALTKVRLKALRRGIWFTKLSGNERKFMDLVIRVTGNVRSLLLANLLSPIVKKLLDALTGEVARLVETIGRSLARKISGIAQQWGNMSAVNWKTDPRFIRYLTIMRMNTSSMVNE